MWVHGQERRNLIAGTQNLVMFGAQPFMARLNYTLVFFKYETQGNVHDSTENISILLLLEIILLYTFFRL